MSDMSGNVSPMSQPQRFATAAEWKAWIDQELAKDPVIVTTDKGAKGSFESLSIAYVRCRMAEIFGMSYSEEVTLVAHSLHKVTAKTPRGTSYEAFTAWGTAKSRVVITLPWGVVIREGLGVCDCVNQKTPKGAIDMAFKGAASDAFKVACRGLGKTLGLELRLKAEERDGLEEQREADPETLQRERHEDDARAASQRDQRRDDDRGERLRGDPRPVLALDRSPGRRDDERSLREQARRDGDARPDDRARTTPEDSRRSLESQREAAFGPDRSTPDDDDKDPRNPNWDPDLEDLFQAGYDRGMARGLATLPSGKRAPEETMRELWDMGAKLFEAQGGEKDPFDQLWQLVEDLKIDSKNVLGSDARRVAVAIMLATRTKEAAR